MKKEIPFDFVIEKLNRLDPVIRPMFGCHAIYAGGRILLALRKKNEHKKDNGVWIATSPAHHESLRADLPSMRGITMFGKTSSWQIVPADHDEFEVHVSVLCDLILRNDPRIGTVPKAKKPRAKKRN